MKPVIGATLLALLLAPAAFAQQSPTRQQLIDMYLEQAARLDAALRQLPPGADRERADLARSAEAARASAERLARDNNPSWPLLTPEALRAANSPAAAKPVAPAPVARRAASEPTARSAANPEPAPAKPASAETAAHAMASPGPAAPAIAAKQASATVEAKPMAAPAVDAKPAPARVAVPIPAASVSVSAPAQPLKVQAAATPAPTAAEGDQRQAMIDSYLQEAARLDQEKQALPPNAMRERDEIEYLSFMARSNAARLARQAGVSAAPAPQASRPTTQAQPASPAPEMQASAAAPITMRPTPLPSIAPEMAAPPPAQRAAIEPPASVRTAPASAAEHARDPVVDGYLQEAERLEAEKAALPGVGNKERDELEWLAMIARSSAWRAARHVPAPAAIPVAAPAPQPGSATSQAAPRLAPGTQIAPRQPGLP